MIDKERIAFIGLGNMGTRIPGRISKPAAEMKS